MIVNKATVCSIPVLVQPWHAYYMYQQHVWKVCQSFHEPHMSLVDLSWKWEQYMQAVCKQQSVAHNHYMLLMFTCPCAVSCQVKTEFNEQANLYGIPVLVQPCCDMHSMCTSNISIAPVTGLWVRPPIHRCHPPWPGLHAAFSCKEALCESSSLWHTCAGPTMYWHAWWRYK